MTRMTIRHLATLAACAAVVVTAATARAQEAKPKAEADKPKKSDQSEIVLRVYDVSDLVQSVPNYPYRSGLPTTDENSGTGNTGFMGGFGGGLGGMGMGGASGGGMGGAGGGMGGMGGGFFQVPDAAAGTSALAVSPGREAVHQFGEVGVGGMGGMGGTGPVEANGVEIFELVNIVNSMVEPESWTADGVSIASLGRTLVVRQTPAVHEEIAAFLEDLREQTGTRRQVMVEAHWVTLDAEGAKKLAAELTEARQEPEKAAALLTTLNQQADYGGRITCQSGQTVHIVSGQRRTVVVGAVPVVGSGSAAYQPQIVFPNIGALLQVRPALEPKGETALLDLRSTLTAWAEGGEPVRLTSESGPSQTSDGKPASASQAAAVIDRVHIPALHLATTIRVPLGVPTVVGGMSPIVDPDGAARAFGKAGDAAKTQTYLIVTVTAEDEVGGGGGGFF